jgi:hypothetical protein
MPAPAARLHRRQPPGRPTQAALSSGQFLLSLFNIRLSIPSHEAVDQRPSVFANNAARRLPGFFPHFGKRGHKKYDAHTCTAS